MLFGRMRRSQTSPLVRLAIYTSAVMLVFLGVGYLAVPEQFQRRETHTGGLRRRLVQPSAIWIDGDGAAHIYVEDIHVVYKTREAEVHRYKNSELKKVPTLLKEYEFIDKIQKDTAKRPTTVVKEDYASIKTDMEKRPKQEKIPYFPCHIYEDAGNNEGYILFKHLKLLYKIQNYKTLWKGPHVTVMDKAQMQQEVRKFNGNLVAKELTTLEEMFKDMKFEINKPKVFTSYYVEGSSVHIFVPTANTIYKVPKTPEILNHLERSKRIETKGEFEQDVKNQACQMFPGKTSRKEEVENYKAMRSRMEARRSVIERENNRKARSHGRRSPSTSPASTPRTPTFTRTRSRVSFSRSPPDSPRSHGSVSFSRRPSNSSQTPRTGEPTNASMACHKRWYHQQHGNKPLAERLAAYKRIQEQLNDHPGRHDVAKENAIIDLIADVENTIDMQRYHAAAAPAAGARNSGPRLVIQPRP